MADNAQNDINSYNVETNNETRSLGNTPDSCSTTKQNNDPNDSEDTNFKGWKIFITAINMRIYLSSEDENDTRVLLLINQKMLYNPQGNPEQYVDFVIKTDVVGICQQMIEKPLEELIEAEKFSTISSLLVVIWNCADHSPDMGRAVVSKKMHETIIESIKHLNVHEIKSSAKADKILELLESMLSILYNTLRKNLDFRKNFRENGVIVISLKYLESDAPIIKTLALFLLAFAADINANKKLMETTSSNIQFILKSLLEPAMTSPQHMSGGDDRWSVQEILGGLSLLSENKENALEMIELGILEQCRRILVDERFECEMHSCLNLIWTMSFMENIRQVMRTDASIIQIIETVSTHVNPEIMKPACGILWNLKHLDEAETSAIENSVKSHIMISYCWDQKSLAWHIMKRLREAGRQVWIDTIDMKGKMFDAMADAVMKASHVICCVSEEYSRSQFCRLEAAYACRKNKPILFIKVQSGYQATGSI